MAKVLKVLSGIGVCHPCYGYAWCTSYKEHKKAKTVLVARLLWPFYSEFDAMNLITGVSPFSCDRIKKELCGNLSHSVSPCLPFSMLVLSSLKAFLC
jgi:hypothetical protein